jgi:hypothetical protein
MTSSRLAGCSSPRSELLSYVFFAVLIAVTFLV